MEHLLTAVLKANSIFSVLTGAGLALTSTIYDETLGVESWILAVVGVGVVGFGLLVWKVASGNPVDASAVRLVIGADLMWVVAAAVILLGFPDVLTTTGKWTLGILSALVLDFATFQIIGLVRRGDTPT